MPDTATVRARAVLRRGDQGSHRRGNAARSERRSSWARTSPRPARPFKVLTGLVDEFGKDRIIDTPISEAGFTGLGVGAAMTGLRPIVDIMFGDFLTLIMDQMVNQAAKIHYMSGGKWKVPMVLRATMGATRRSAAQHSQSLHAWPSHIPGLKVVVPVDALRRQGPVQVRDSRRQPGASSSSTRSATARSRARCRTRTTSIPLGVADVKREGSDITIVATSSMVQVALGAAKMLEEVGISAEVVDPRTTWPLDEKTLIESVKKTSRCIVMDEGYGRYGVTASSPRSIARGRVLLSRRRRSRGSCAMHVPIPFSPSLEDVTVPSERQVFDLARAVQQM